MNRDEDEGNYKPLAFLAVVAFGVSLLFSIVSVTLTVVALVTRRQLLEAWLIPLAFVGVLLSIAARWQIQLSEGAREGRRLTNIAWWMSLIGGCIYAAYFAATVMAISSQCRKFIKEDWMDSLKSGKIEDAYLLTLPPDQRKNMTAADISRRFGDLDAFREEPLPKLFERSPEKNEIEVIGSPEWQETPQGLDVSLNTMVHTPLGNYLVTVSARGVLSKDRGTRDWYILRGNVSVSQVSMSEYGALLKILEDEAAAYMKAWTSGLSDYNRARAYYCTLPINDSEREKRFVSFLAQGVLSPALNDLASIPFGRMASLQLASRLAQADSTIKLFVPEMQDFGRDLIRWDDKKHEHSAKELAQTATTIIDSNHLSPIPGKTGSEVRFELYPPQPTWYKPQFVRASMDVQVRLPSSRQRYRGQLYIVRDDRQTISELARLRDKMTNRSKGQVVVLERMDEVKSIMANLPRVWRIAELDIDLTPFMGDRKTPLQQ